eukprot:m.153442 g.153442  ORF g.153442 m.153442 type:complete len:68 (+) comp16233_c3_seq2:77-280(+)
MRSASVYVMYVCNTENLFKLHGMRRNASAWLQPYPMLQQRWIPATQDKHTLLTSSLFSNCFNKSELC